MSEPQLLTCGKEEDGENAGRVHKSEDRSYLLRIPGHVVPAGQVTTEDRLDSHIRIKQRRTGTPSSLGVLPARENLRQHHRHPDSDRGFLP